MGKQLFTWGKKGVFFQNKDSSKQCSSLIHQVFSLIHQVVNIVNTVESETMNLLENWGGGKHTRHSQHGGNDG